MKLNRKIFLGLTAAGITAAAIVSTTVLKAEDKTPAASGASKTDASTKADSLFPDPVIARGTGVEIKRSALDEAMARVRASADAYGQRIATPDLERLSFDRLLQMKLLNAKATDTQKAEGKAEGEKSLATMHKQVTNDEMFAMQLKSMGITEEQLRTRLTEAGTAQAVLRSKISVADAEIKKFYDENPTKFQMPEKVRAAHILVATGDPRGATPMPAAEKQEKMKLAQSLLKRARANEDFAKLAKEYSDDPGSKDKGGEYTFTRGEMIPEFESAAFSLQTNQISDIVTTVYGYHIIKLLEKFPPKKLEFAEVKSDIKDYLDQKAIHDMLPEYYASLKKEAKVEILDADLKALEDAPVTLAPADAGAPAPSPK